MRSKNLKVDFFEIIVVPIVFLLLILYGVASTVISFFRFILSPKFRDVCIGDLWDQRHEAHAMGDYREMLRLNKKLEFYERIDTFLTKKGAF